MTLTTTSDVRTDARRAPATATVPGEVLRVGVLGETAAIPLLGELFSAKSWCRCATVELNAENDFGTLRAFDVMLLVDDEASSADKALHQHREELLRLLRKRRIGVLILTDRAWRYAGFEVGVVCLPPDASLEKVQGVLIALSHMRPLIRQVDKQLGAMQRVGKSLQKRFDATDRELQLAARLQRDFLPKELPDAGPFRFTTLFRPCSWVSGDIFDVFRLDETHWGFYLADAIGHGVAAGLLTMYIKHAIRPKRILRDGYELVSPSQVMSDLNNRLASQELADAQFISGWYGMLNIETRAMSYAVAGHPPALLIDSDGRIRELHGDGCLLGINPGEAFSDESVHLKPGDRVVLYSDGLEPTLIAHRGPLPQMPVFSEGMADLLRLPADTIMPRLRERLDTAPGSLAQADDVTVVMVDVEASPAC